MRLWTLISGYDDAPGLERACRSVRRAWPGADRCPIVYADGAYEKFPHEHPGSSLEVMEVAERFASLVVRWPVAAPTEFLKRASYWAGAPGDRALILDTDEEIEADDPEAVFRLEGGSYLIPLVAAGGHDVGAFVHRLFRIGANIHHWGSHEAVFDGMLQCRRASAAAFAGLRIVHHRCAPDRETRKRAYYQGGIIEDESAFRRLVGV